MTQATPEWLACAIDTEGSIVFARRGARVYPYIRFVNTNREIVERFREAAGGKSVYVTTGSRLGIRPIYACGVSSREQVEKILRLVLPHLIVKRAVAERTLEYFSATPPSNRAETSRRVWNNYTPEKRRWRVARNQGRP